MLMPSMVGWSMASSDRGSSCSTWLPVTLTSVCSVENLSAIIRARGASLNWVSSKAMVNVLTRLPPIRLIKATTAPESIPPLRNAPKGTSATICIATVSLRSSFSSSRAFESEDFCGWATVGKSQ